MSALNLSSCLTYVAVNRLIADRFEAKAKQLIELTQSVEDIDERLRLADLAQFSEDRAAMHVSLALTQERDLGVKCHCPKSVPPFGS